MAGFNTGFVGAPFGVFHVEVAAGGTALFVDVAEYFLAYLANKGNAADGGAFRPLHDPDIVGDFLRHFRRNPAEIKLVNLAPVQENTKVGAAGPASPAF